MVRRALWLLWVLWPAFLVAGMAEFVFFSIFDPQDLIAFGHPVDIGRQAVYAIGFFCFWVLCALSAALTLVLRGKD